MSGKFQFYVMILWLFTAHQISAQPTPPFPIHWINLTGATLNGNTLNKAHSHYTWTSSGAISSNTLEPNQDGWVEFTAANGHYIIGFAKENTIDLDAFTHAFMINSNNNTYAIYEGSQVRATGTRLATDVFRISREGSEMKYYINGEPIRTINITPAFLRAKASIAQPGTSAPLVYASFDAEVIVQATPSATEGNQMGNIPVGVLGAKAPYTFSWSSGEVTSSVTNKERGTYSLTVTDALGRAKTYTYTLGYKVNWINAIGVSINGSRLTKTQPHFTWIRAGAVSSNTLAANTDGWMEFTTESVGSQIVGFAANNIIDLTEFTSAIQMDYFTNSYVVYEGSATPASGYWQPGDVFRISREGSSVKYYKNGTVIRTVTVNPATILRIKTSILRPGATTPNINMSFDAKLILRGTVLGLPGNSGSGSVSFSTIGGTTPHTYSWSSGETTGSLTDKQRGTYTVSVSDAIGRTASRTYKVGYQVNWAILSQANVSGTILTKTNPFYNWDASGGVSANILRAQTDGWMEFSVTSGAKYGVGFATNNTINITQFTNGIVIDHAENTFWIYEGSSAVTAGPLELGDVFRISREGGVLKYYQNESVIRQVNVNATLALRIKASIFNPGGLSPYINSSFWTGNGIPQTYYSVANGNWTTPSTWSLTENGAPSGVYPDDIDKVVIKGHQVTVNSDVKSTGVTITSTDENTKLKVDGNMGVLTVKGNIVMNRENNENAEVLVIQNNGRLDVR